MKEASVTKSQFIKVQKTGVSLVMVRSRHA